MYNEFKLQLKDKERTIEGTGTDLEIFLKDSFVELRNSKEAVLSMKYYPTLQECTLIKSFPQIKELHLKVPREVDSSKILQELYGAVKIEYDEITFDDIEFINDYIIFEKNPDTNKTSSGIIIDKKEVTFNTDGIVFSSTSDKIKKGDRVFTTSDKCQFVTIGKKRYFCTHEKYIFGFIPQ